MIDPKRRLFNVSEYHAMMDAGILREDERVELIEGEILFKIPTGSRHSRAVAYLDRTFQRSLSPDTLVFVQGPVFLNGVSEARPDITVVRFRYDFYVDSPPAPQDALLFVEVAAKSRDDERDARISLYGRSGVSETWLVKLRKSVLEVYRQPTPHGYAEVRQLRRGETVSPQAFPELQVKVDEILG
ncbi:MAG TPA: Uma2 family endonuclease [Thermoanaerobaculia bacterium]|nr:Uma2 family endonuclease [Thermoanaerobaculia bacterium]